MRKVLSAGAVLAVVGLLLAAVASGSADKASQSSTLVFGASAEPTSLDGAVHLRRRVAPRRSYQIYENLVAQVPGNDQARAEAGDGLEGVQPREGVDVHAPSRRDVPRRHALQREGRLCELRPLVQLQGRAGELVLLVLLQRAVRRVQNQGQGEGAVQELSDAR